MASSSEYDVLVYGSTAPGIVAAVRAAREGLRVCLVSVSRHLGGALPSLGAFESHYRGVRAPILQELTDAVRSHYRDRYGENSEQFRICGGGGMVTFEPHVGEAVLTALVAHEPRIDVRRGLRIESVRKAGTSLAEATFQAGDGSRRTLRAGIFFEASYEGDLMDVAGAEFRVGRESRAEFGEPSAGRVFTQWLPGRHPIAAVEGRLNLVVGKATTSPPLPGSTGEGDDNIQSYSYRLCLTDNPDNRRLPESPPRGYDRAVFAPILLPVAEKEKLPLPFHHRFLIQSLEEMVERDHVFHGHALPNRKRSWNATNLTGAGKSYARAGAAERRDIEQRHLDHALGLMWFLQNDSAVPASVRSKAGEWGLARDEFTASDNLPPQLYVREARRLVGRAVFREQDALLVPGAERAPVHPDSIAITEFSLDSLACTTDRLPGSLCDGQLFQMEVSRPGQVPYGVTLPCGIDNLLVVTTVSATHVGWGTMRQTPTLMHVAESAAWAAVIANRRRVSPARINVDELQRTLVEHGIMITFFNDLDMASPAPWLPAAQYFGAKGEFPSYDAKLTPETGAQLIGRYRAR
jgi:hypothetical protein